jgi:hypothetical protein
MALGVIYPRHLRALFVVTTSVTTQDSDAATTACAVVKDAIMFLD